jgi:hypothetical protein
MFFLLVTLAAALSLRARAASTVLAVDAEAGIIADGFSRVGCLEDGSPKEVRLAYFATTGIRDMQPSECFWFCRDKPGMRFFMIAHGRDCYCSEYYHDVSTGGGDCSLPCEGDTSEMCGGNVKASAFEMHMCGKSASRADATIEGAEEAASKASNASATGESAYEAFKVLSDRWQLGICSKAAQICDLSAKWLDGASEVRDAAHRAEDAANASSSAAAAVTEAKAAGFNTSDLAGALESAMATARDEMSNAAVKAEVVSMSIQNLKGLLGTVPEVENVMDLFESPATNTTGWHAICSLEPLEGMEFMWVAPVEVHDDPKFCADVCVSAGEACVGFNYQASEGAIACQMLSKEGVFSPETSMLDAFGIFEVSKSKVADLGYDSIDCFVTKSFLARNGGIKPSVVAQVIQTA